MQKIGSLRYVLAIGVCLILTLSSANAKVRIVSANLSSGGDQTYDPGHGIRILSGLQTDIVLVQEFKVGANLDRDLLNFAQEIIGEGASFFREEEDGGLPNGIISRYPIVAHGEVPDPVLGNRDLAYARIDVPGPVDLWAFSVHFYTKNSGSRAEEARTLVTFIQQNIPESDFVVVGGDLNTKDESEPAIEILEQVVSARKHQPKCTAGKCGTNASRKQPYDWVMPNSALEQYHVPVVIEAAADESKSLRASKKSRLENLSTKREFEDGLVFDSRTYPDLKAVAPAQRDDSSASNMQHMAIVKDFAIPE